MVEPEERCRRGLIFDLDGTLADTLDDITTAINATFARRGHDAVTRSRVRELIGEGLTNLLRRASGIDSAAKLTALVDGYRDIYRECMLASTRLYPGVAELLDEVARRGIPLAVLSNKPDEFTVPICESLLSAWPFVACRGARDEKRKKPEPSVALMLAETMGCRPSEVFFVGDSSVDVLTAHRAGMPSIAVTWGYRDREELAKVDPAHWADQPADILALLGGEGTSRPA